MRVRGASALLLEAFAKLRNYLARGPACALDLFGLEGDRADDGVAAAAVALADRGDVVAARARAEGVRADGDFRAEGAARDRDRVGRLRAQVVGDELVEAFDAFVSEVEVDDAALVSGLAPDGLDRLEVAGEGGTEAALHLLARRHFVERARDKFAYDALDEIVFGDVLDDLHQLERGLSKLDGLRRRLVERAVNRVRPSDERAERRILEAELFGRHARDELGARLA